MITQDDEAVEAMARAMAGLTEQAPSRSIPAFSRQQARAALAALRKLGWRGPLVERQWTRNRCDWRDAACDRGCQNFCRAEADHAAR